MVPFCVYEKELKFAKQTCAHTHSQCTQKKSRSYSIKEVTSVQTANAIFGLAWDENHDINRFLKAWINIYLVAIFFLAFLRIFTLTIRGNESYTNCPIFSRKMFRFMALLFRDWWRKAALFV